MHGMWGIWFLSQESKMFVPEWFSFPDASQTGSKLVNTVNLTVSIFDVEHVEKVCITMKKPK